MQFGIIGKQAPELRVSDWVDRHGQPIEPFTLAAHAGKVRLLYCFQSWCPGCHEYGFPALQQIVQTFATADLAVAVIQTVFEGFAENGPEQRQLMADKYQLDLPFGHDDGRPRPAVISDYRTGGTPWFIMIDRNGVVVANDYHLDNLTALLEAELAGAVKISPEPTVKVKHNPAHQQFEVDFGDGSHGVLNYRREGKRLYLTHTEVPENRRGQGLGAILMEHTLEAIEKLDYRVVPVCAYTRVYLKRYKRWAHLLDKQ